MYLKLGKNDHVYLAVVLDLFNREVVGWSKAYFASKKPFPIRSI